MERDEKPGKSDSRRATGPRRRVFLVGRRVYVDGKLVPWWRPLKRRRLRKLIGR